MSHSSEPSTPRKPKPPKPPRDYPLSADKSTGQWCKKIKGKRWYFGSWRLDPTGEAARDEYERKRKYLEKGQEPPPVDVSDGCTLHRLCNHFLATKEELVKSGELSLLTFRDHHKTCARLLEQFGKDRRVADLRPDDFRAFRSKLAETLGPVSLKNVIVRTTVVFNHAHENGLIERPVNFGSCFDPPSVKVMRKDRAEAGAKLFERDEVLRILDALRDEPIMRAMFLLTLNGGLGNSDVGGLREKHLDLAGGWLDYARQKTGVERRIPLWPETLDALKTALAARPRPKDEADAGLVFLTRNGRPWVRIKQKNGATEHGAETAVPLDAVSPAFKKVLAKLGINGRRGLGFYTGRHTFETQAGECTDQVAVDAIMGHHDGSMASVYRHGISDVRLRAAVETVRTWLFAPRQEGGAA